MQPLYEKALHHFEELTSSNEEARDLCYGEGDWLVVERQTAGRGQRGHTWLSEEGLNLTATLVLEPRFLEVRNQFALSQAVALAVGDLLAEYNILSRIKWTNDIYWRDRKMAGILIEHSFAGEYLNRTLVGVGLNINQRFFDPSLPNPTSMLLASGMQFDREEVAERLWRALMRRYEELRQEGPAALQAAYHARLWRRDEPQRFRLPSGEEFRGVIRRVEPRGELVVENPEGNLKSYLFREIVFVLEK